MKKSIKTIVTIVTICIALVGAYVLGATRSKIVTKIQTISEAKEMITGVMPHPEQRIMTGNYYDYMVIKTMDGNAWLLDDTEGSPYIKDGVAIFEEVELVQVVFDTMGTETVTDDVIVDVRSIDRRYK